MGNVRLAGGGPCRRCCRGPQEPHPVQLLHLGQQVGAELLQATALLQHLVQIPHSHCQAVATQELRACHISVLSNGQRCAWLHQLSSHRTLTQQLQGLDLVILPAAAGLVS
jgi:hypothetical protein